ncbi:MAG TPA: fibronectin type III domain-containing protein [Micromonosporaceae bacterium]
MLRKRIALLCATVLTSAIALALTPSAASAATNLLTNPGFETGDLSGWSCNLGSNVTSPVHSGSHALAGAASNSDDAQCTQNVAVVSGSQYTLSAYVEGNYVYLGVTGGVSTWTPSATGWTLLTTTFTATSSSAQVYLHGWYAQGTYHADDVSLTGPGGTVTVPSAPTGLTVTGTTSSSVSLSWAASSGATGYNVYRGSTKVASVSGTTDTVTGLTASTAYTFSVTATNSAGESAHSSSVNATTSSGTATLPNAPTGLTVTGTTSSTVGLAWTGSSGATGYNVYQGSTKVASVSGTSDTVTGLAASTAYTFSVTATNSAGESAHSSSVNATTAASGGGGLGSSKVWPYIDITMASPTLAQVAQATGQKFFTLAFVLGSSAGCVPAWGGTIALNDSRIAGEISALRAMGGDVAVSFGGAEGPYLSSVCSSVSAQAAAYEQVIDAFNIKHIDFDVEASIPIDTMNKAIAQVQRDRPGTTVSYTLEVVADSYGIVDSIGTAVLTNAVSNGVNVSIVNPMTMDYGASAGLEWGDSVIAAANATEAQMATIWPSKTSAQLYAMLGVTPMIGRNDTGPIFSIADAQKLVTWADGKHVGELAFWSVGRDNGGCPGGGVSPTCSSISQSTYQFTSIFAGYTG